jgi:hypothetical protein
MNNSPSSESMSYGKNCMGMWKERSDWSMRLNPYGE